MNYILFDLEATCWDTNVPMQHEIIEIGAIKVHVKERVGGYAIRAVDEFNTFVQPVLYPALSRFCQNLTHITQDDINSAPTFPQAVQKFRRWCEEEYWLVSWGFYDHTQLYIDCALHELERHWLTKHISLKHQWSKMTGVKRPGMTKALSYYKLDFQGTQHRAINDARNMLPIFERVFSRLTFTPNYGNNE